MGIKYLTTDVKGYKRHEKRGAEKSRKRGRRDRKHLEKAGENMVTEDRLRSENIGSGNHIYHSWTLSQFYSSCQKRGYHLNGDSFFITEKYYRKVCIKSCKLGLKIAKFS